MVKSGCRCNFFSQACVLTVTALLVWNRVMNHQNELQRQLLLLQDWPTPQLEYYYTDYYYKHSPNLTIRSGELPGYTGWARPASTLANCFSMDKLKSDKHAHVGRNFTVTISCSHFEASTGGALFDARAYGRSILPALTTDHRNGTYEITVLPFDAGLYHLEVVMAFSNPPASWTTHLPLPFGQAVTGYEGYLLPGFPLSFSVLLDDKEAAVTNDGQETSVTTASTTRQQLVSSSRQCTMAEMREASTKSALQAGRWVVESKAVESIYQKNNPPIISLSDSLGLQMEYLPTGGCRLASQQEVSEALTDVLNKTKNAGEVLHFVFLGDSNARKQRDMFRDYFIGRGSTTTHIPTNGGIVATLEIIKQELSAIASRWQREKEKIFLIFNTGLHDIQRLCIRQGREDPGFSSCFEQYKKTLQELVEVLNSFPAALKVWQTTLSAWPKWGNYNVAWPASLQAFPRTPHACHILNEIAWEVMSQNDIFVMDSYWLSLSRPDHRGVKNKTETSDAVVSNHLAHAGPEVYSVLTRKWAMMILEWLSTTK